MKSSEVLSSAGKLLYLLFCTGGTEPYGIEIVSQREVALQEHITGDAVLAEDMFNRLVMGKVRPCHLTALLEDWVCR